MGDPFNLEPDLFDVTLTVRAVFERGDSLLIEVIAENGTGEDGDELMLQVTNLACNAYGLDSCVAAVERFINSTLRPEFRLDAALAMGAHGPFTVVPSGEPGPRVIAPGATLADAA